MRFGLRCTAMGTALMVMFVLGVGAARGEEELVTKLRAFTPDSIVANSQQFPDPFGNPRRIDVVFKKADFDQSKKFAFLVVGYNDGALGAIRLLKLVGGELQLVGDVASGGLIGGGDLRLELVDIDSDGVPEVVSKTFGLGTDFAVRIFKWTGSALRGLTPEDGLSDAELEDIDGDGILEAILPPDCLSGNRAQLNTPCEEGDEFQVYKLDAQTGEFKLAFKSPTDPTNPTTATGQPQAVFAFRTIVMPSHFPLADIEGAAGVQRSAGGVVTLRLGNVSRSSPGQLFTPVAAGDVNLDSFLLGSNVHSLRAEIIPAETDEMLQQEVEGNGSPPHRGRFQGPFVQLQFSRQAVLSLIAKAQPTKPLAVGDKVTLEIKGRMNNGAPLEASVAVLVVGSPSQ